MNDEVAGLEVLVLEWDKQTVCLEALERALYAVAELATGTVEDAGSHWKTLVHARSAGTDVIALAHRVRQEVNDHSLRLKIAEQTAPVRDLIFAVAFSRSGLIEDRPKQ